MGIGYDDAVLIKCWSGCEVTAVVVALGLELLDLFPRKPEVGAGNTRERRRHLLTAAQALDLLNEEIALTRFCATTLAGGEALDNETRERLLLGAARVSILRDEVYA